MYMCHFCVCVCVDARSWIHVCSFHVYSSIFVCFSAHIRDFLCAALTHTTMCSMCVPLQQPITAAPSGSEHHHSTKSSTNHKLLMDLKSQQVWLGTAERESEKKGEILTYLHHVSLVFCSFSEAPFIPIMLCTHILDPRGPFVSWNTSSDDGCTAPWGVNLRFLYFTASIQHRFFHPVQLSACSSYRLFTAKHLSHIMVTGNVAARWTQNISH